MCRRVFLLLLLALGWPASKSKHPPKPPLDGACSPDLRLRWLSTEGYGLSWSKFNQGHLLSGSDDAQICLWDINATSKNKALEAMQIFKGSMKVLWKTVAWHLRHEYLFGSVGDDQYLLIYGISGLQQLANLSNLLLLIKVRKTMRRIKEST